jgi:hypothetical protein
MDLASDRRAVQYVNVVTIYENGDDVIERKVLRELFVEIIAEIETQSKAANNQEKQQKETSFDHQYINSLRLRDLRRLDPNIMVTEETFLLIRRHAILIVLVMPI